MRRAADIPQVDRAVAVLVIAVLACSCARHTPAEADPCLMPVQLPSGAAEVDVYIPVGSPAAAPMVIVAHGFTRRRHNMAGWGRHLAAQGILAVVPDLPTWADHERNGRFLAELRTSLLGDATWGPRIDPARTGLMGFSAGGLSSLLAAARTPDLAIWVGLDPVDRDGLGAAAAAGLRAEAVVLTAEPSAWNAQGNAAGILAALPRARHVRIAGAVHVDAEWPTSWLAELACGRSTGERRQEFQARATEALQQAFALGR